MNNESSMHDEMQDRLMDLALRRKLGTEQPCDLSEKIGSVESLRPTPLMSRTWFRLVIAASVLVTVGWAISDRSGDLSENPVAVVDESFSVRQSGIRPDQWETTTIRAFASDVDDEAGDEDSQYENEAIIQEGTTVQLPTPAIRSPAPRAHLLLGEIHDFSRHNSPQSSGDGIVVYNLPTYGRYDRTPVLPPVGDPALQGQGDLAGNDGLHDEPVERYVRGPGPIANLVDSGHSLTARMDVHSLSTSKNKAAIVLPA